jgi:CheY-like chemotaxis protein
MSPPANASRQRLLCVDDRASSLEVRRTLLKQMGYEVLLAVDPADALKMVGETPLDLVIMDYSFPGHMNGEELARHIRAKCPGLPLLMLTGFPELPESARASVDLVIVKGEGGPTKLLNAICKLLAKPVIQLPDAKQRSRELAQQAEDLLEKSRRALKHR